mgnify:CR=1 FL=1
MARQAGKNRTYPQIPTDIHVANRKPMMYNVVNRAVHITDVEARLDYT